MLANNVETLANAPGIVANGAAWFREIGSDESPGSIVCTVTGATQTHGVGEFAMGTALRDVIDDVGGGVRPGHRITAVIGGVSAPMLPGDAIDVPLTHEDMAAAGSGLGSASFIVLDDDDDVVAHLAGASRFLAVESCGQCEPCKRDGLDLAERLGRLSRNEAEDVDVAAIADLARTVSTEARCALARQHEAIVTGVLQRFARDVDAHCNGTAAPAEPALIADVTDIAGGVAETDESRRDKQPDWTYDETDSGKWPANRL